MNKLLAGFCRIENTPSLGAPLNGYNIKRLCDGFLDPLEINTLAVSDGENTAVIITYDSLGMDRKTSLPWREEISRKCGIPLSAIYITASHSHTAPGFPRPDADDIAKEYFASMGRKVVDSAILAVEDMKPARLGYGVGEAPNIAFCRRYIMKDGSCHTNPGVNNPEIDHVVSEADERVSVLRFDREGAETILLINFACHPDVIGGNKFSADWPGFARRTTERVLDNVKCLFANGAQGDINHVNVHPTGGFYNGLTRDFDDVDRGYEHARYMGRVVTGGVLQAYDKVKYIDVEKVSSMLKVLEIPSNKPNPEDLPEARRIMQMYNEDRCDELPYKGMMLTTKLADARRKVTLADAPDNFELELISIAIGDVAFVGIPGEPFNEIGVQIKRAENWDLVIPTCLTNGYQGYFPTFDAYAEGGYEAGNSKFKAGVAERIIAGGIKLLEEIRKQ